MLGDKGIWMTEGCGDNSVRMECSRTSQEIREGSTSQDYKIEKKGEKKAKIKNIYKKNSIRAVRETPKVRMKKI